MSDAEDVATVGVMATVIAIAWIIDHHIDEHGHGIGGDGGGIADLVPVDPAVSGRAVVDELVA